MSHKFDQFVNIVRRLRKGCPWDREQTFETLKPYLVEEVYEVIQAIDDKQYAKLAEELGDMLLHIVMLSVFAEEGKKFGVENVIDSISQKMVRRHPHVFGKVKARNKAEVWMRWEKIKGQESHKGILESIPRALPALYRADKVQKRAARVGFDWDQVAGAWGKVHEELDEVKSQIPNPKSLPAGRQGETNSKSKISNSKLKEELGDLLFAIVNVARKLNIDAEEALQEANSKFMRRFSAIEKALRRRKMTIQEMDALWNKVKAKEKRA